MTVVAYRCPRCEAPMKPAGEGEAPFLWPEHDYKFTRWECECGAVLNILKDNDTSSSVS